MAGKRGRPPGKKNGAVAPQHAPKSADALESPFDEVFEGEVEQEFLLDPKSGINSVEPSFPVFDPIAAANYQKRADVLFLLGHLLRNKNKFEDYVVDQAIETVEKIHKKYS